MHFWSFTSALVAEVCASPRKNLALFTCGLLLNACTPDAQNTPSQNPTNGATLDSEESQSEEFPSAADNSNPEIPLDPLSSKEPGIGDSEKKVDLPPAVQQNNVPKPPKKPICPAESFASEHPLIVREVGFATSESPSKKGGEKVLELDFSRPEDRTLQVVSLYVNKPADKIPTFTNNFKFTGTSYWMVAVDNPFDEFFSLPHPYGNLPSLAVDVTKRYGGTAGGLRLTDISEPTCLKFTIVTFEPEQDIAFRQSEVRYSFDPENFK